MSAFASVSETRRLGAPVVRLYRVALGRDPDPAALRHGAARLRQGAALHELAEEIAAGAEFHLLHGPDAPPDAAFVARIAAHALTAEADRAVARTALLAALGLGGGRAALIALLADAPLARATIPLLPGLAPGASPDDPTAYQLWIDEYDTPAPADPATVAPPDGPLVSILMAAGDSTVEAALHSLESLRRQTHPGWELLLATRLHAAWPGEALAAAAVADARLRLSGAAARGDFVCFLDPGDTLAPHALRDIVAAFAAHPQIALLYTDEDVADAAGRRAPRFKPDFSPDLLLAGNSIGQVAVYRAALLNRLEGCPQTQYERVRQAAAAAGPQGILHLPAVLCHRAAPPTDWPASDDASAWPRLRLSLPDPPPLVSVIIPTRDQAALLAACIDGVLSRTDYPALEVLVVDNGSADPAALALLARLATTPRVRVLRRPGRFNFAHLNNAAAAEAEGEVLLLLNNDTEVLHPEWLGELVAHALRPEVGAVGAKLLYPDGRVQHAGLLLGPAGAATHVGRFAARDAAGYDGQLACTRDLSAVTGACLALRRAVFRTVGGMEERLAVAWNDVDLCLRVRAAGLRVIWTPHAVLLHRELATRGREAADPAALARFRAEQDLMRQLWGAALDADPFLNPNLLASEAGPLVLTRPRRGLPWQQ